MALLGALLFFQVKHSALDATSHNYPSATLKQWYQLSMAALQPFEKKFELVLVLITNRVIDMAVLANTPRLVIISQSELAAFLGPLAKRGLLAL